MGLARTFQNIRLSPDMTVLENVMIGRHCRTSSGIFRLIIRSKGVREEEQQIVESSYQLLKKVGPANFANEFSKKLAYGTNVVWRSFGRWRPLGGTLSGGEQQMPAISRALMARPFFWSSKMLIRH